MQFTHLATLLRYTEEGEWETLPAGLSTARYRHTALAVTIPRVLGEEPSREVRGVADELAELGITSEYRVSLAWASTADLDIYVQNVATGEIIYWSSKESADGNTILDVDNQGGTMPEAGKKYVENISFNGTVAGTYAVFVNCHHSKRDVNEIPFVVLLKEGAQTLTFEDSWNINQRGESSGSGDLDNMIKITTINIEGNEVTEETSEATNEAQEIAAVAEELANLGITSEYRASLAWESTADLDIYVENAATGEIIYYANKRSNDSNTILDADNRGGSLPEAGEKWVENISFNGAAAGSYIVYINCYHAKSDVDEIPFIVVTKVGTQTLTFDDSWNITRRGDSNGSRNYGNMIKITTIVIEGDEVTEETSESTTMDEAQEAAAVAEELVNLGITSEYRASLAWASTADLDIYVQNVATGEIIYWSSKESADGNTILDVDNQGGTMPEAGKKWVENISFNGSFAGAFKIYVTNYDGNNDVDAIPFVVVVKVGDQTQTFENSWNITQRGSYSESDVGQMMMITTINILGSDMAEEPPESPTADLGDDQEAADVAEELANLGITSEYRATLAWESTADLDIHVKNTETGEIIYWNYKVSNDGDTTLDVDNRGGDPPAEGTKYVENVSFNGDVAGTFDVYVNCYSRHSEVDEIAFIVVAKVGQQTQAFDDSWNTNEREDNKDEDIDAMMKITTINIVG